MDGEDVTKRRRLFGTERKAVLSGEGKQKGSGTDRADEIVVEVTATLNSEGDRESHLDHFDQSILYCVLTVADRRLLVDCGDRCQRAPF